MWNRGFLDRVVIETRHWEMNLEEASDTGLQLTMASDIGQNFHSTYETMTAKCDKAFGKECDTDLNVTTFTVRPLSIAPVTCLT